jgi:hypothetical protein
LTVNAIFRVSPILDPPVVQVQERRSVRQTTHRHDIGS